MDCEENSLHEEFVQSYSHTYSVPHSDRFGLVRHSMYWSAGNNCGICAQAILANSKFLQKWPFANMVMKSWYPGYIRVMGIVVWVYALICFYFLAARF